MSFNTRLQKWLPHRRHFADERLVSMFGARLKQPEYWRFNRDTISVGIAVGLFCAYLPMPFQMIPAIAAALYLRGNLPVTLVCVWITNPLTWIALFAPAYQLGAWVLHVEPLGLSQFSVFFSEPTNVRLVGGLSKIIEFLAALWTGSLIIGTVLSGCAYLLTRLVWRVWVVMRWRSRARRDARRPGHSG